MQSVVSSGTVQRAGLVWGCLRLPAVTRHLRTLYKLAPSHRRPQHQARPQNLLASWAHMPPPTTDPTTLRPCTLQAHRCLTTAQAVGSMSQPKAETAAPPAADPKLQRLRQELSKAASGHGVDAIIIPSEDPHMVCVCMCVVCREATQPRAASVCSRATPVCSWACKRLFLV